MDRLQTIARELSLLLLRHSPSVVVHDERGYYEFVECAECSKEWPCHTYSEIEWTVSTVEKIIDSIISTAVPATRQLLAMYPYISKGPVEVMYEFDGIEETDKVHSIRGIDVEFDEGTSAYMRKTFAHEVFHVSDLNKHDAEFIALAYNLLPHILRENINIHNRLEAINRKNEEKTSE